MSRSRKKNAIGATHDSEKIDKKIAHRIFRKRAKQALKNGRRSYIPFKMRDVSNVYNFSKDGKYAWFSINNPYNIRSRFVLDDEKDLIDRASRK